MRDLSRSLLQDWETRIGGSSPRVAVLGWARLSAQEREGSGLNLSVSELCAALASRGSSVLYLRSGMDYSLFEGMHVQLAEIWRGVACFDLFNSPNLAPGNFNLRNAPDQIRCPSHTALVIRWLKALRVRLVHVHAIEGFSFDLLPAIRSAGIPVVVTPHNYYAICPQVDLLRNEQRVCEDYQGGAACATCLSHAPDPATYRQWRRRYQTSERWLGPHAPASIKDRLLSAHRTLRDRFFPRPPAPPGPHPTFQPLPAAPADQGERLLAANAKLVVMNSYGERRKAGIAALNAANTVLCPSRFILRVHESFGVEPRLLRHVPLGQPHFDAIRAAAEQCPFYRESSWGVASRRPLRVAYFGNCYPNKGLATLVEAIAAQPPSLQAVTHYSIRAAGEDRPFRARLQGFPNVVFLGRYDIAQLPAIANDFDVCCFPNMGLENSPFVVLESLHAGRFVIASRLGGPTDFIDEGRNGLLFAAGNITELNTCLSRIVYGSTSLPSRREIHQRSALRSFESYVTEVQAAYRELVPEI